MRIFESLPRSEVICQPRCGKEVGAELRVNSPFHSCRNFIQIQPSSVANSSHKSRGMKRKNEETKEEEKASARTHLQHGGDPEELRGRKEEIGCVVKK